MRPDYIRNPAFGIYDQNESYRDRSSGYPRENSPRIGGCGSVSCIKCRTAFSITIDKRLRPKELECPFCFIVLERRVEESDG